MADFKRFFPHTHLFLRRGPSLLARSRIDFILLLPVLMIMLTGMVVLYSGSGNDIVALERQLVRYGIGLGVMFIFVWINIRKFEPFMIFLYLIGIGLLLSVLFFGVGAKGAQRWLEIAPGKRFQPAEILKLMVPVTVAWFLAGRKHSDAFINTLIALILVAIPVYLIAMQPDLGTAILIGFSGLFVIFYGGLKWRYAILACVLAIAASPLLWGQMRPYQKQRIRTFLNPESDPLGAGWNIIQSKIAIGSGGITGKGWLEGTQSHLNFLPETHTDFIMAVLAEEFGLLGLLWLLSLYLIIIIKGLLIASKTEDAFSRMVAASLVMTFFIYVLVNMGMVTGLLPIVGVPLPLISYGGTSVVTLMISIGILMSIRANRTANRLRPI